MKNNVGKHSMNGRVPRKSVLSAAIFAGIAMTGFGAAVLAADDTSLTWNGITLYGTVDVGIAYQTHDLKFFVLHPSEGALELTCPRDSQWGRIGGRTPG